MKRAHTFVCFVSMSFLALSCIGALGVNLFPDSKDIELGRQIDEEIRKNPQEYPILKDRPDIKAYVEGIGNKVLRSPAVTKKGKYAYQFEIIHDDSTVNAFCTPGGYIYVYTGLIRFLDNEAALAGVIGHEIAHAERRHATRRMSSALGVQVVLSIALGENPPQLSQIAGNLFGGLGLLVNSRSDETESDTYAIRYLQSTEYYPGAIRYFFEKVSGASGRGGGTLQRLLSTHPLPQDRIDNVERIMKEIGNPEANEANLFSKRYQELIKTLP
ncbi:MAG: M48 family metalloprotease [Ignavibacteriales bacterium]|nr:M48 family metalloprotease [Ignavibacteriales bacterium]